VDNLVDEVHEKPHHPDTNHVGTDIESFPSGLEDTSVLTDYGYHVAARVWVGGIIICLIVSYLNNYLSF